MAVEGVIDIKGNLLDHNPLRCVLQKNAYKNVNMYTHTHAHTRATHRP